MSGPTPSALAPWYRRAATTAVLLLVLGAATSLRAEVGSAREYQVKAAFLLRFIQFVEWPDGAFADQADPIRIGILGVDPFGANLDQIIVGERIRQRPLVVKRARSAMELRDCQVVFIAGSEKEGIEAAIAQLPSEGVLTVSDSEHFAERGGIIRFFLADKKVRFELNPAAAQQYRLKLSAQLLNLGRIVGPAQGAP